jgi:hypothetical protein
MEILPMGACTGKGNSGNSGSRHQQVWVWPSMPSHWGNCAVLNMLLHRNKLFMSKVSNVSVQ